MAPRIPDVGWLSYCFLLALAASPGKPASLPLYSIRPFAPGHDILAAWPLAHGDGVGIRERTSHGIVDRLGHNFGTTPPVRTGRRLGISVRRYHPLRSADPEAASKNYVSAVSTRRSPRTPPAGPA